jgi:glutamyl-tRNA synthetase
VNKAGAKFDFEKAKWFNAEWIKRSEGGRLKSDVKKVLEDRGIFIQDEAYLLKVINLVKERCTLLPDFYQQSSYFFEQPKEYDLNAVKPKWTDGKTDFYKTLIVMLSDSQTPIEAAVFEEQFKKLAEEKGIKAGELMLPFRIMLVGGKFGPHVFDIAGLLGKQETIGRIEKALAEFTN